MGFGRTWTGASLVVISLDVLTWRRGRCVCSSLWFGWVGVREVWVVWKLRLLHIPPLNYKLLKYLSVLFRGLQWLRAAAFTLRVTHRRRPSSSYIRPHICTLWAHEQLHNRNFTSWSLSLFFSVRLLSHFCHLLVRRVTAHYVMRVRSGNFRRGGDSQEEKK